MSKFDISGAAEKFISKVERTDSSLGSAPEAKKKLTQRSYYITDEQYKAIKVRAVEEGTNTSKIVRNALNAYLGTESN